MASISSLGVGSGLDIASLVNQLVAAEGSSKKARFDKKEAELQAKISALGTYKSALADFQSSFSKLKLTSTYSKRTATPDDSSVFTASASSTATSGNYTVEVNQLAQAHTLASKAFTDVTTAVGTGSLTFEIGSYDSGTSTFTADASKTATVTITDSSLTGIRDAVNNANIGVQASLINDGTGYRLVFTSDTGSKNSLKITASDDDTNNTDNLTGLSQLAYDPAGVVDSGKNLTEQVPAQDASLQVNGITVSSSSNTVTGAVDGVTLTLKKADVGVSHSLSVSQDTSSITKGVTDFVDSYNSLMQTINQIGGYDSETKTAGIMIGDATLRGVTNQLRNILVKTVGGYGTTYNSLASIGILTKQDGTLEFDSSALSAALADKPEEVRNLLAGGASDPPDSYIRYDSISSSLSAGTFGVDITQLASQGYYSSGNSLGASFYDLSGFAAGAFTLQVDVDGTQSGTVTLTSQAYASGDALAAELQKQINADATLSVAGKSVTVSYDSTNNQLLLNSTTYGSTSSVSIVAASADMQAQLLIGDAAAAGSGSTAGLDVAGTIGGESATGSGRILTGADTYSGVSLEILGGATGFRGNITIENGLMSQMDSVLDSLLTSGGLLDSRTSSLSNQVNDINDQRETLQTRLDKLQERYVAQFSAMDSLVAQLNSTSTYLSQQIGSLSKLTNK